jgi:hypothetical protein
MSEQQQATMTFGFPAFWQRANELYAGFFEAAKALEDPQYRMFKAAEAKAQQPVEKVVYFLTRVTAIGFSDVVILAANGCGVGAMKIGRGMFESSVVAEYLRRKPEAVEHYIDFGYVLQWRRYEWLRGFVPGVAGGMDAQTVKDLEANYNRVKPKFTNGKRVRSQWSTRSIGEMAREIGRGKEYDLTYSLSSSMHHANAEGILAHVKAKRDTFALDAPPSEAWVREALGSAHVCMLLALDTLNECCALGFKEEIKAAEARFHGVWRG